MFGYGMELVLPYPPSVNTYWRSNRGRVHISAKGRAYREQVGWIVKQSGQTFGDRQVAIRIELFPPDARRRDLDNACKGLLDALEHGGLFDDDSQICDLHLIRREIMRPDGQARVTVVAA
ncbi:MAG: RusA family crossover junction endodeoxyribonuclease [Deltaproteobacteria bacterium]|nr:MAG: RusA family crossover junction endodeoxyribonuclease [Deltaproteobacteria bacterium]